MQQDRGMREILDSERAATMGNDEQKNEFIFDNVPAFLFNGSVVARCLYPYLVFDHFVFFKPPGLNNL